MLTAENYQIAWGIYVVGALGILLYLRFWWRRHITGGGSIALLLLLAALILTPAHPGGDTPSYAPALVVAAFDLLTYGPEAAIRPLRPIGVVAGAALITALIIQLLRLLLGRRNRS
jgi:hypothetical protein